MGAPREMGGPTRPRHQPDPRSQLLGGRLTHMGDSRYQRHGLGAILVVQGEVRDGTGGWRLLSPGIPSRSVHASDR